MLYELIFRYKPRIIFFYLKHLKKNAYLKKKVQEYTVNDWTEEQITVIKVWTERHF